MSTAETGYYKVFKKPTKHAARKLSFIKFDPLVQRHVLFVETKLPSGRKKT